MRKITILLFVSTCSFMYNNNSLGMDGCSNKKLFVTLNDNTRAILANNLLLLTLLQQNTIKSQYKLNKERINLQESDCINQQEINKLQLQNIVNTEIQLNELSSSTKIELGKLYTLHLS